MAQNGSAYSGGVRLFEEGAYLGKYGIWIMLETPHGFPIWYVSQIDPIPLDRGPQPQLR